MRREWSFLLSLCCCAAHADSIEQFNQAFARATRAMDIAATMALWEKDGISLLPGEAPILGKAMIEQKIRQALDSIPGARMRQFDMTCHDVDHQADWASEWCEEHQIVDLPKSDKPFDGRGRMLLILHRGADGRWRLRREMWTQE